MTSPLHPRTWVEISRAALAWNISTLQANIPSPNTTLSVCVKANAYGHDIASTVKIALECGVTHFVVDSVDEALIVRSCASTAIIFIVGMIPPARVREAVHEQFVLNIYDETVLHAALTAAIAEQKTALINIEVETGLYRLGATPRATRELVRMITQNPRSLTLVGLSTHLSSAEDPATQHVVDAQVDIFERTHADIADYGVAVPYLHIANSAATILRPALHGTMVRTGIALYGLWPSQEVRIAVQRGKAYELRPALSWKTLIAQVKDVPSGGGIGYDRTFITNKPMRIAILPVGYWDGYDRGLSGRGQVLIAGRICSVVGRICMNMMMVDVSATAHVHAGDTALLIGRDGMHQVSAEDLALAAGTINYEIVTRINPLIPRIVV